MVFMCSGPVCSLFGRGAHEIDLRCAAGLSPTITPMHLSLACLASTAHDLLGLYESHCRSYWDLCEQIVPHRLDIRMVLSI